MPTPKLGSKEGSNLDEGRGASQDALGSGERQPNPKVAFFGASDGSNTDTQNTPVDKGHGKPTL